MFEPRADIKGDIARGLLYFYTRYSQSRPAKFTARQLQARAADAAASGTTPDPVTTTSARATTRSRRCRATATRSSTVPSSSNSWTSPTSSWTLSQLVRRHARLGAALVALGLVIAASVRGLGAPRFDLSAVEGARQLRDGGIGDLLGWVSRIGYAAWFMPIATALALLVAFVTRSAARGLLVALAPALAAGLTNGLLKPVFERPRPLDRIDAVGAQRVVDAERSRDEHRCARGGAPALRTRA